MHVRVRPAAPGGLPDGVSAAVLADDELVGVYYAQTLDTAAEKRCAAVSAALTAIFGIAPRNGDGNGRIAGGCDEPGSPQG